MKVFGTSFGGVVLLVLSASMVLSVSAGPTKEHKKKLLEKLRAALNASEPETSALDLEKSALAKETYTKEEKNNTSLVTISEEVSNTDVIIEEATTELSLLSPSSYIAKIRSILKRFMELLGLRKEKRKDGRTNRMLELDGNEVDRPAYRDEIKLTVGAVMGQKECIQKVACGAGTLLKEVKGKQIIFALMESLTPAVWKDTVKVVKQSAFLNGSCNYKCLED